MTTPTGSECRRAQLGTGGVVTTPTGTECCRAGLGVQRLLEFSAPPLCPRQAVTIPKPTLQVCHLPSCVLHPRPYKGAPGGPTLIARAPVLVRGGLPRHFAEAQLQRKTLMHQWEPGVALSSRATFQ